MKGVKKLLCVYLSCALILMGCGPNFLVKKDKHPVITIEEPVITKEKTREAKVIFLHRFASRQEPYKKLTLSNRFTFYAAQKRIKKEGGEWKAFVNNERVILRSYGVKNGQRRLYGPGYLKPGYFFICKLINTDESGNRIYSARFIGQCGNEIPSDDLLILETPVVITERVLSKETMVYTNIDHKWTLLAGIGGILLGLGLGYLFWYGATETVVASTGKSAGVPCPPGTPAPR